MNTLHIGSKDGGKGHNIKPNEEVGLIFQEGGSEEGLELRRGQQVPEAESARKKYFLDEEHRKQWEWEAGRTYGVDFFNPYLDFNSTSPWFGDWQELIDDNRFCVEVTRLYSPNHEVLGWPGIKVRLFSFCVFSYFTACSFPRSIILSYLVLRSIVSPDPLFCRKEQKRSHTLRYVLKNRKTNEVLLVVLFTLYLNEDIDEAGNIKPGVETGIPFDQLAKEKADRHDSRSYDAPDGAASEGSAAGKENTKYYEGDDDVD